MQVLGAFPKRKPRQRSNMCVCDTNIYIYMYIYIYIYVVPRVCCVGKPRGDQQAGVTRFHLKLQFTTLGGPNKGRTPVCDRFPLLPSNMVARRSKTSSSNRLINVSKSPC